MAPTKVLAYLILLIVSGVSCELDIRSKRGFGDWISSLAFWNKKSTEAPTKPMTMTQLPEHSTDSTLTPLPFINSTVIAENTTLSTTNTTSTTTTTTPTTPTTTAITSPTTTTTTTTTEVGPQNPIEESKLTTTFNHLYGIVVSANKNDTEEIHTLEESTISTNSSEVVDPAQNITTEPGDNSVLQAKQNDTALLTYLFDAKKYFENLPGSDEAEYAKKNTNSAENVRLSYLNILLPLSVAYFVI